MCRRQSGFGSTGTPIWKIVCAMAVSSGVLSFPLSPSRKDQSSTPNSFFRFPILEQNQYYPPPMPSFGTHRHVTKCEATQQQHFHVVEEPSYVKMSVPERGVYEGHAIFGVLLGENMIERYDVYKRPDDSDNPNVIVAHIKLGHRVDGHPGVVHGGILSLIFDDILGYGFEALGIQMAFTANLSVDYRAPVPAGTTIRVQAQLEQREGRKLFWKAQMTSMDKETLFAECSSLYVIPRSHST